MTFFVPYDRHVFIDRAMKLAIEIAYNCNPIETQKMFSSYQSAYRHDLCVLLRQELSSRLHGALRNFIGQISY